MKKKRNVWRNLIHETGFANIWTSAKYDGWRIWIDQRHSSQLLSHFFEPGHSIGLLSHYCTHAKKQKLHLLLSSFIVISFKTSFKKLFSFVTNINEQFQKCQCPVFRTPTQAVSRSTSRRSLAKRQPMKKARLP